MLSHLIRSLGFARVALLLGFFGAIASPGFAQPVGVWIEAGAAGNGGYENSFGVAMEHTPDVHAAVTLQVGRIVATARGATLGSSFESSGSIFRDYERRSYSSFEGSWMVGYAFPVTPRVQVVPLVGYAVRHEEARIYDTFCIFCSDVEPDEMHSRTLRGASAGLDAHVRLVRVLGLTVGARASLIPEEPLAQVHAGIRLGWLR